MQYVKVLLAEEGEEPGATGIQPVTEVIYLKMLNAGVHPVIPERGSVSEVDVTCLPHKGLAMLGEGKYTIKVSEFCI